MLLIILPVKNESENAIKMSKLLRQYLKGDSEALFIDDGSTDDTLEMLNLINHPKIKIIKNRFDRGKGSALKAGYIMSENIYKMRGSDLICFLDSDCQINPKEIDTFLRLMKLYNADAVIGNKRHTFSSTRYTRIRRVISEAYSALIRFLFDIKFQDTQCGIKIYKKSAIEKIIDKINVKRYAFDLEMIIAMRENHLRIIDAPIKINEQINRGSIGSTAVLHTFFDTLKIWVKRNNGEYVNGS